jgi:hypothetical protein
VAVELTHIAVFHEAHRAKFSLNRLDKIFLTRTKDAAKKD